jgi:hypothetical protein
MPNILNSILSTGHQSSKGMVRRDRSHEFPFSHLPPALSSSSGRKHESFEARHAHHKAEERMHAAHRSSSDEEGDKSRHHHHSHSHSRRSSEHSRHSPEPHSHSRRSSVHSRHSSEDWDTIPSSEIRSPHSHSRRSSEGRRSSTFLEPPAAPASGQSTGSQSSSHSHVSQQARRIRSPSTERNLYDVNVEARRVLCGPPRRPSLESESRSSRGTSGSGTRHTGMEVTFAPDVAEEAGGHGALLEWPTSSRAERASGARHSAGGPPVIAVRESERRPLPPAPGAARRDSRVMEPVQELRTIDLDRIGGPPGARSR